MKFWTYQHIGQNHSYFQIKRDHMWLMWLNFSHTLPQSCDSWKYYHNGGSLGGRNHRNDDTGVNSELCLLLGALTKPLRVSCPHKYMRTLSFGAGDWSLQWPGRWVATAVKFIGLPSWTQSFKGFKFFSSGRNDLAICTHLSVLLTISN